MRKYILVWSFFLSVVGLFTACQKQELYVPADNKVTDLAVPDGFDWNLTRNVSLKVVSTVQTSVSIYTSSACTNDQLVAVLPVFENSKPAELSVPAETGTIYVQFTKSDGTKEVMPVSLTSAPTRSGTALEVRLPEGAGESANGSQMNFYPSMGGYGTLLFEDSWPNQGDYDFNDLVARYQIVAIGDNEGVTSLDVWIQLTALGGVFPYQLGLVLDGVATDRIASIQKGEETGEWGLTSSGSESAAFLFKWENLKGMFGGNFYNTEYEYDVDYMTWRKQVAFFTIQFKDKVQVNGNSFNFFIGWPGRSEIHLMGYRPTDAYSAAYGKVVADNPLLLDADTYYKSSKGFVWGLKIPETIAHAREGVDFNSAYKNFAGWVLSGGRENQDWYKHGDPGKLMPAMR